MPDSKWTGLKGDEARRQEAEYDWRTGIRGWGRTKTIDPPKPPPIVWLDPVTNEQQEFVPNSWDATKTETFVYLFSQGLEPPAKRPVIQYCDRCGGHVDTLVDGKTLGSIAVPHQNEHVNAGEYGHRNGNLYMRYQVRGTILRRTVDVEMLLGDGGATAEAEKDGTVKWERKTVDHVEQGPYVHWITRMHAKDCKYRVGTDAFGFRESDIGREIVAVLRENGLGESLALLDDGEAIAEVAVAAAKLDHPTFSVVPSEVGEELELDLVSFSEDNEAIVRGRLMIGRHEGDFMTVVSWKAQTDAG